MRARDNPFRVERLHGLDYRFERGDWPEVLDRLAALGNRAAVVGPRGHGKTTFLGSLAARLERRGETVERIRLRADAGPTTFRALARRLTGLCAGRTLLLDGAGLLPERWWSQAADSLAEGAGCVVTAHSEVSWPTLHRCETSPALLVSLVRDLLGSEDTVDEAILGRLWRRRGGDLRACLRDLYDARAGGPTVADLPS